MRGLKRLRGVQSNLDSFDGLVLDIRRKTLRIIERPIEGQKPLKNYSRWWSINEIIKLHEMRGAMNAIVLQSPQFYGPWGR